MSDHPESSVTSPSAEHLAQGARAYAKARRKRRAAGFVLGMLGLVAAVVTVANQKGSFSSVSGAIENGRTDLLLLAILLPFLSWLFTTGCFWSLTARHGNVGFGEMGALMGSSWLLNFLPFKPGLAGRVAYHKTVNQIDIKKSMEVLARAIVCGGLSIAAALAMAMTLPADASPASAAVAMLAPVGCVGVLLIVATTRANWRPWGWTLSGLAFRYADVLVWSARYLVAFELIGRPVTIGQAVAIAGVSQLATLLPLVGNGLGVREWAVGLVGSMLPAWFVGAQGLNPAVAQGLSADLVNRVAEVLVAVPLGLGCIAWIAARMRRLGRSIETGLPRTPKPTT